MRLPGVCRGGTETTVWAHSNRYVHGKGYGLKADDRNGCYACYWCHMVYDRQFKRPPGLTLQMVERAFIRAMRASQSILVRKGLHDLPAPARKAFKSKKASVPNNSQLARLAR